MLLTTSPVVRDSVSSISTNTGAPLHACLWGHEAVAIPVPTQVLTTSWAEAVLLQEGLTIHLWQLLVHKGPGLITPERRGACGDSC